MTSLPDRFDFCKGPDRLHYYLILSIYVQPSYFDVDWNYQCPIHGIEIKCI